MILFGYSKNTLMPLTDRHYPELIPIGRDVLRSSKRDWLVRERSAICFLISQSYGGSLGV